MKAVDEFIFLATKLVFHIIPVAFTMGGVLTITVVPLIWFFGEPFQISHIFIILLAALFIGIGSKWDEAVIEYYPTAMAVKDNSRKTNNEDHLKEISRNGKTFKEQTLGLVLGYLVIFAIVALLIWII